MLKSTSLEQLCHRRTTGTAIELSALLPDDIRHDVGHFNVFNIEDLLPAPQPKPSLPYNCRTYYKISLLRGRSRAEYPNRALEFPPNTLVFSMPKAPFYWWPLEDNQTGKFCFFTPDFLQPAKSGVILDELPVFRTGIYPIFPLSEPESDQVQSIFEKMQAELTSDYLYKYDLLRTYVLELIHFGQKRQSATTLHPSHSASAQMTSRFIELLEQQFPLESPQQLVRLHSAKDFADRLAVHINHLNKVLKSTTGLTTTELIGGRITQEAKILLRQTNWTIAEIAFSLGFADVAHFSKFFKRQTALSPGAFRETVAIEKV